MTATLWEKTTSPTVPHDFFWFSCYKRSNLSAKEKITLSSSCQSIGLGCASLFCVLDLHDLQTLLQAPYIWDKSFFSFKSNLHISFLKLDPHKKCNGLSQEHLKKKQWNVYSWKRSRWKKNVVYVKGRVLKRRRGQDPERELFYLLACSPNDHNDQSWIQSQKHPIDLLHGYRGPRTWTISSSFSRIISTELDRKCSSQNSNQHPHRMLTLQALALPTEPAL